KTNKFSEGDLSGHVTLREFGKVVLGNHGHINFSTKVVTIDDGLFHLTSSSPNGTVNFWGRMQDVLRDTKGVLTLHHATYTSCKPTDSSWHFDSSTLKLDKTTGTGTATNAVLYLKKVPVLYTPYARFPIDTRRKTGFLFPTVGYSSQNGYKLYLPFYMNLAPNYDDTLTPEYSSNHGVLWDNIFRYMTDASTGQLKLDYIYGDKDFKKLKQDSASEYSSNDAALKQLEDSSDNRYAFSFQNQTQFNDHWSDDIDLNYVSDDYFLHDYGGISTVNDDQLGSQFDLNYEGQNWRFLERFQAFQTLHELDTSSEEQYSRLPQLDLIGTFPNQKYGLTYQINNEFVYFDNDEFSFGHDDNDADRYPVGSRINIQPAVSLPLNWGSAFLDPKVQVEGTFYSLDNLPADHPYKSSISRVLPIVDIDSGLIFDRQTHVMGNNYTQTLEPRLFYLYVPDKDQDDIPLFDTDLSTFDFDNLFRTNRFSSIDRVGDANQLSAAVTSRFLDANTGQEKLRLGIGEIFAFKKHDICTSTNDCLDDPLTKYKISPIYGELKYYLSHNWNMTSDVSWDPHTEQLYSTDTSFEYRSDSSHIINLDYNFTKNGDSYDDKTVNLNRIDISAAWKLWRNWQVLGDWNHNLSYHDSDTYLAGVEYDNCCWAIRFVAAKIYKDTNEYDSQYYVQFLLKGIGSSGFGNAGGLLTDSISGYQDNFANRVV
ncbi:MAG: LPS assembly protein LptD, partial [Gammaproteobacteria bacterium]|nr:LPS assembly protein LptD [Gammaproteobacteria bacterium]